MSVIARRVLAKTRKPTAGCLKTFVYERADSVVASENSGLRQFMFLTGGNSHNCAFENGVLGRGVLKKLSLDFQNHLTQNRERCP